MRQALNENPRVQLVALGIAGLILAIVLYTSVLSGGGAEPAPSAATADATAPSGAAATEGVPAPPATAPSSPTAPAPSAPAAGDGEALAPTKGLPKGVLVALAKDRAVALIVVDPKGSTDKQLKSYVNRLSGRDDVEVFDVKAAEIARYSRITQGVSVSRTPALVVVSPRDRSGELTASVSYGFRGAKSVEIALEDALYRGGTRSAAP